MAVNLDIFAPQMSRVAEGLEGKVILVYGGNNLGKAQPVNTMIPTPDGLKRLGDLQVGDAVFDRSGKITKVLEIYEQGLKDNYKVTLADGRTTYCNDEHLWTYYTSRNNLKTLTLKDMVDRGIEKGAGYRFQIPMNNKVNYPEKEYDVDPYVVGCFIGDGCTTMTALTISSPDEEIVNEIVKLIGAKKAKKCSDKNYSWNFEMFEKDYYTSGSNTVINFQTKNLFKNCEEMIGTADKKRIPQKYLFGSIEQRLSLLQGLMDTDGTINAKDFNCRYDTVHFDLAKDVVFLLNSLGISATINSYVRDEKNVCYYININTPNENKHNLFRMSRKKKKH